jgi:hypothetical protein
MARLFHGYEVYIMDGLFHGWLKNIEYPFISMDLGVA